MKYILKTIKIVGWFVLTIVILFYMNKCHNYVQSIEHYGGAKPHVITNIDFNSDTCREFVIRKVELDSFMGKYDTYEHKTGETLRVHTFKSQNNKFYTLILFQRLQETTDLDIKRIYVVPSLKYETFQSMIKEEQDNTEMLVETLIEPYLYDCNKDEYIN